MRKLLAMILVLAVALTACTSGNAVKSGKEGYDDVQEIVYLYAEEMTTLNFFTQGTSATYECVAQLCDGLVEYDKYGIMQPAVAESWEVSDDGLVWTFHLRNDATWVDHQGNYVADVTADDFVAAAEYVLDKDNASLYARFYTDYFVNAEAFYEAKDTDEEYDGEITEDFADVGIKALDDYTLEYTLITPVPYFLSLMNWVPYYPVYRPFIEEVGENFGVGNDSFLYNGAFYLETWEPQSLKIFIKNELYYAADDIYITKETDIYNTESSTLAPEMFLRGEINYAYIGTAILDDWLNDPVKAQYVRPSRGGAYTYFYAFNFDPKFDEEYEPDNWRIAVNNRNFRLAIFHALDRMSAVYTSDPYNPQNNLIKTITPPAFANVNGKEYTEIGALAYVTLEMPTFDAALAEEYRDKAKTELEEAGATFPVKIFMPYNTNSTSWGERAQVVKANLERVLGTDFIEVIIYGAPPTNFLADNRRSGKYALLECNWGPDYDDPETYSDPFLDAANYNWPSRVEGYVDDDGNKIYANLVAAAKAEVVDIEKRFELFAEAEAFLITEAFVIPYVRSIPGWVASYLNPFDGFYSPTSSMTAGKYNGLKKLNSPMNADQFNELYDEWKLEREAALKAEAGK